MTPLGWTARSSSSIRAHQWFGLLVALGALSCRGGTERGSAPESAAAHGGVSSPPPLVAPYPFGAWRLASQAELERTVLWLSHILIRHAQGRNSQVSFSFANWHSVAPPPTRTRLQALELARKLAADLEGDPSRFGALARQYSEDITTKDLGGELGGVVASQLSVWPPVLDALAVTPQGSVSQPVETEYGFHVIYRAEVPEPDVVTGVRIVIAHDQAPWLRILARGELPKRTRDAAQALANSVYERAQADPESFADLVARHSEHRDAEREGDFGTWSTRDAALNGREIAVLRRLAVGEVSPPVDTVFGFQIIKRVENRPRHEYAMKAIRLLFNPDAALGTAGSRAAAFEELGRRALEIGGDPVRFADARRELGSMGVEQWQDGRGTPAVQAMLDRLALDEVAREPVLSEFSYVLAQRVHPTPSPAPLFELPEPSESDLPVLLGVMSDGDAASLLIHRARAATGSLELEGSMHALHQDWQKELASARSHQARVQAIFTLQQGVRDRLGEEKYAAYLTALRRDVEALLSSTDAVDGSRKPGG